MIRLTYEQAIVVAGAKARRAEAAERLRHSAHRPDNHTRHISKEGTNK